MSLPKTSLYVVILIFVVFGMALFLEFYKKTIRKDRTKTWENRLVGFILSVLSTFGLYYSNLIFPILDIFNAPFWTNLSFYILAFYYFQRQADMKLLKKVMRVWTEHFLKKAGLSAEEVKKITDAYEENKKAEVPEENVSSDAES